MDKFIVTHVETVDKCLSFDIKFYKKIDIFAGKDI